jgi:hypothetical protein
MLRSTLACFACACAFGASLASAGTFTAGPASLNPPFNGGSEAFTYLHDDGTVENGVGITDPAGGTHDIVWLNRFAVTGGNSLITSIQAAFGSPADTRNYNGIPVRILLYSDADGGSPANATLLQNFGTTITNGNTGILNSYDIPDTNITTGTFWVGVAGLNVATGTSGTDPNARFLAAIDQTTPHVAGVSWAGFTDPGNTMNLSNLGTIPAGALGTIEGFGLPGNWAVRAVGDVVPEPASLGLLALTGLFAARRRK